jgi:sulfite exporter TauE/SafE
MSEAQPTSSQAAKAANLFDLRRIIGGVFVALGLLLTILGLTESQAEIDKAAGVNINLWAGVGMLVFGLLMIAWALIRPLSEELGHEHSDEPGGGTRVDDDRAGRDVGAGSQQREY